MTAINADPSNRELYVFRLLGPGMTNAAIAAEPFLSEGTVHNYVSSVAAKRQVEDRADPPSRL